MWMLVVLFLAGLWAGTQNALAGGGSFITLPALILSGLDARAANITSTIALFPGQVTTAWAGRSLVAGTERLSVRTLVLVSLVGGVVGGALLLATPSEFFARLVPWLVLFATSVFAWGSFRSKSESRVILGATGAIAVQFAIAVYGGYFGGGIGFLMLAALTMAGLGVRVATATKNVLAAVMNASAVVVFLLVGGIDWLKVAVLAAGAIAGGMGGAWALHRVNERVLRVVVVAIGLALTVGLFLRDRP